MCPSKYECSSLTRTANLVTRDRVVLRVNAESRCDVAAVPSHAQHLAARALDVIAVGQHESAVYDVERFIGELQVYMSVASMYGL